MSEFHAPIVRVGAIEKHPNADSLSLTKVFDYPVILRTGDFNEGDLAAYVPVDAIVPPNDPRWAFLGEHRRIRAKRLRGIFSMGLLTAPPDGLAEGDDAVAALGLTKYEPGPDGNVTAGLAEKDPGIMPVYDLEALRRYSGVLAPGEQVVITEKIHGANARFVHDGERLWVGSRTQYKIEHADNLWWRAAAKYELATKLATVPNIALYGEVYGQVQDLTYGVPKSEICRLAFFDALDVKARRWLDWPEFSALLASLGLPTVPVLHVGSWANELRSLAEGSSMLGPNVREGIVIKPVKERYERIGRVALKLHGEGYLTRKAA